MHIIQLKDTYTNKSIEVADLTSHFYTLSFLEENLIFKPIDKCNIIIHFIIFENIYVSKDNKNLLKCSE